MAQFLAPGHRGRNGTSRDGVVPGLHPGLATVSTRYPPGKKLPIRE